MSTSGIQGGGSDVIQPNILGSTETGPIQAGYTKNIPPEARTVNK